MARPHARRAALLGALLAASAGLSASAPPVLAADPPGLIIASPGSPEGGESGERIAQALAAAVLGEPARGRYLNSLEAAEAALTSEPAAGLLSLPLYLKWRAAGRAMTPLASVRIGGSTRRELLIVTAAEGGVAELGGLAGQELHSAFAWDPRFVTRIAEAAGARPVFSEAPLSALKACGRGELPAVLIDSRDWETLQGLRRVAKRLRVLHRVADIPNAVLVAFKAPGALAERAQGIRDAKLLEALRIEAFAAPEAARLEALAERYEGEGS